MRGHLSIFEARLNGHHPSDIWFVLMDTEPTYTPTSDPENLLMHGYKPEVHVYSADRFTDLRFVYGTNVHIIGSGGRCDKLVNALKRFKPKAIYQGDGSANDPRR